MEGMSGVLFFLSIKVNLKSRVTFFNQSNRIFICFPNIVQVPSALVCVTYTVCLCVCVHICVYVYKKKEGARVGIVPLKVVKKKKQCSQKSNDSLPKLIYLSINDGYIPPNGFIN